MALKAGKLQVYLLSFNFAVLVLTFWVLPMLLTAATPFRYRDVVGMSRTALIHTAEGGGAWTVLYPDYTVVIPKPTLLSIPLAYAVAKQNKDLLDFVNAWISLKKGDGMIKRFLDHWILGQGAADPEPRWSVLRNVLSWGK